LYVKILSSCFDVDLQNYSDSPKYNTDYKRVLSYSGSPCKKYLLVNIGGVATRPCIPEKDCLNYIIVAKGIVVEHP